MKSILFIAFLAIAAIGCDTPENTTGSDTSAPPTTTDTTMTTPSDTTTTTPMDTTTTTPMDTTSTTPSQPTDTTTTQ